MKKFKFIILIVLILVFFSCDNTYFGKKEAESDINSKKENTETTVVNSNETEKLEDKKLLL